MQSLDESGTEGDGKSFEVQLQAKNSAFYLAFAKRHLVANLPLGQDLFLKRATCLYSMFIYNT
jgi:hypothetical protein